MGGFSHWRKGRVCYTTIRHLVLTTAHEHGLEEDACIVCAVSQWIPL